MIPDAIRWRIRRLKADTICWVFGHDYEPTNPILDTGLWREWHPNSAYICRRCADGWPK